MATFWISTDDGDFRWGDVTEKEVDLLVAYAVLLLGDPDTIA